MEHRGIYKHSDTREWSYISPRLCTVSVSLKGRSGSFEMRSVGLSRCALRILLLVLMTVRARKISNSLEKCGTDFVIDVDLLQ